MTLSETDTLRTRRLQQALCATVASIESLFLKSLPWALLLRHSLIPLSHVMSPHRNSRSEHIVNAQMYHHMLGPVSHSSDFTAAVAPGGAAEQGAVRSL